MVEMNGVSGSIQIGNPIVQLLEQVLAQARAGQVGSIAIVAVGVHGGVYQPIAGNQFADLYIGCGMVQHDLMKAIKEPRSPIVRAPAGALEIGG